MTTPASSVPLAPEPGRRERKRQQTADHLADTAWSLFAAQGFEAVTMEAIAEAADVAKGTLYKHFPVKEALLRHRFHRELEDALPALFAELAGEPSAAGRLRGFLRRSAEWSAAHREFLPHYVRFRLGEACAAGGPVGEGRSGMHRIFAGFIAAGQASGEFRADADPGLLGEYLQFLYLAAQLRWLADPGLDLGDAMASMLDLFLHGVEARP